MKLHFRLLIALTLLISLHQAVAQITFTLTSSPAVSRWPKSVVAADVNGDGKVDLISANQLDNTLTVLTNAGSGIFGSNATYAVGSSPGAVVAADVNTDGKVDLISGGNTMSVLTNNGTGHFTLAQTIAHGAGCLTTADVNGDSNVDLMSSGANTTTLIVWTNNGNGTFGSNATYSVGVSPSSITSADVNGDGKMDLICANLGNFGQLATLSVLTNNGKGNFTTAAIYPVASSPSFIIAADVNGDGKPDLIYVNNKKWVDGVNTDFDNTLTIWTNNGSGLFSSNATYIVGYAPSSVVAADVNGDGKLDLITANYGYSSLSILTNNGSGAFALASSPSVGIEPWAVVATDVNNDGKMDLICGINTYYPIAGPIVAGTLSLLINNSVFPTPILTIMHSGTNLLVSWPSSWTNWTLLQNTNLATTNWVIFSGAIGSDGTNKSATNALTTGNKYFRLSHP